MTTITVTAAHQGLATQQHRCYIDVRTQPEYQADHSPAFLSIPLDQLRKHIHALNKNQQYVLICESGICSQQACQILVAHGLDARSVTGGMQAWRQAGLPTQKRATGTPTIMRQVHGVVGGGVVLGSALGYSVNSGFVGIAAFLGAGLLFSGITNTCGMAMVLAKMPWNKA